MTHRYLSSKILTHKELVQAVDPQILARGLADHAGREVLHKISDDKERLISDALLDYARITAEQRIRVDIKRPRWMPPALHRWLLRQIVVVETPMTMSVSARR